MTTATSVIIGPAQHGVVRHALAIADATGANVARRRDAAACLADPPTGSDVYHWHFTDRLFGPTVDDAAAAFRTASEVVAGRHVVTFHDVPAATSGDRDRRRAAAYGRVASCCHAVVVASEHERRRLIDAGVRADVAVIPLPIVVVRRPPSERRDMSRAPGRTVGILGFIYPGKGHADVIAASDALPADVRLVALGRASDGHDDLAAALRRDAERADRELVVTGFLDDAALAAALDEVDVPIVPAPDVSASASLGTWIGAGRRPLVVANDFAREVAAMGSGLVTLYEPDRLGAALGVALADPGSTRRSRAVPARLGLATVAATHVALYRRVGR